MNPDAGWELDVNAKPEAKLTAREAALKALVRLEKDNAYLNLALEPLLRELSPRDKTLAVRIAYGTVQRLNTIDWILDHLLNRPLSGLTPWIRNIMRLSAYQLYYLERIPAHAAVDAAARLAGRYGHRGVTGLVNAVLRRLARGSLDLPWPGKMKQPVEYLALEYSQPAWLARRRLERYGLEEAEALCRADNEVAPLSLRPNRLRVTAEELRQKLLAEGVEAVSSRHVPGMLQIKSRQAVAQLKAFREGLFTVQGDSSALVAPNLDPQPGEEILDLCSAPGGKTTHLAELISDCGRVHAVDIHPQRLRLVEQAARRLGLSSINLIPADGRSLSNEMLPPQDRILVDAPCSGLGVIRRLPEIKWRRRESDLAAMQKQQLSLLQAAAVLLTPGGRLLYSVCSNEAEETTAVVKALSRTHPGLVLQDEFPAVPANLAAAQAGGILELLPHRHGVDGFYMALWRKPLLL
ncbi:MAG: 16S rRNA (cytosine(967)-C(5))-methyltransferase RsmB [Bacillota bacterium]